MARIEPHFPEWGITRLADITWLDDIGIPVFQAVRPNSYTVSVAQGKGLTAELAKVSAAMEAIESWHAERIPAGPVHRLGDVVGELPYDPRTLPLVPRHHLSSGVAIEWVEARRYGDGTPTLVPMECVRLDGRVSDRWHIPLFHTSSNGLASGNTWEEAALHGLYEVIERDAIFRAGHGPAALLVDPRTVGAEAAGLLERFDAAGVTVRIDLLPSPVGVACVRVRIAGDAFATTFQGTGAHLDREVALCRALTEAAQSRLTAISGVRDDIPATWYRRAAQVSAGNAAGPELDVLYSGARTVSFGDVESGFHQTLTDDLRTVTTAVRRTTGHDVLTVDLTQPQFGVPVVRVLCPGLRYDPELA